MKQYRKNGKPTKTFINFMRQHLYQYYASTNKDIYDVYEKPSKAKLNAWERIKELADSTPYITSYNIYYFTACYFVYEDDIEYFIVKTGYNTYAIIADLL